MNQNLSPLAADPLSEAACLTPLSHALSAAMSPISPPLNPPTLLMALLTQGTCCFFIFLVLQYPLDQKNKVFPRTIFLFLFAPN